MTKWTFWLSPLHHIRNRAKWRFGDPPSPDLTNFRAYVGTLPASKLGDSGILLTQNFETYTDKRTAKRYVFGSETGNDGRLNQKRSYLSLNYVNIVLKLHILINQTYWLSPLHQIHKRAKRRSGVPSSPDLTNIRAYVRNLPASELGDSRVHHTQNFETYID